MAKKTTEQFVEQLKEARGDVDFNYSKVVYTGSHGKIDIICNACGYEFSQDASNHLKGVGCPKCSNRLTLTNETFLERIESPRRDRYDYSRIDVKNNKSILQIRCKKHDVWFSQKAADHLSGRECKLCARENTIKGNTKTTEQFVIDAESSHGNSYDYTETEYVASNIALKIFCPNHQGFFWQVPETHLAGRGCPTCAKGGYKSTKSGSLYVLVADSVTKVGITNRTASDRLKKINKSSGLAFSIEFEFRFSNGRVPLHIENQLLKELNQTHQPVNELYEGSTESFLNVEIDHLISRVTHHCQQFYKDNKGN